ncbi:MAG TPA: glycerol kinase GlpK [Mesotoga infera]|jgi:glycerol kinase|nr:glycerol kinase GlpK [Thermotogaceae bacterium]HOI34702.1 glycerol kinase GlpK [Mesotoga infera]HPD37205.1 glycerol kinase GlpK [Mesotoga infera]HRR43848.1 glycerol kinase GlpK [Mesotoga sp.]HRV00503.1 glycerol kinase GlpK [Mesotoga sp.]
MSYILAIDQGTSSSKAVLFDEEFYQVAVSQEEFRQIYPNPGRVEHDPRDIILSTMSSVENVVSDARVSYREIEAIGITNQRETVVAWDAITGQPLCNAIVWQDRRTTERCKELREKFGEKIHLKTGLMPDPYFSATKMEWMLQNVPAVQEAAKRRTLRFGTIDSWLVWNLTREKRFVCDYSNASRTMLFNIQELKWDRELLDMFGIDEEFLPKVVDSCNALGASIYGPEIAGIAGDQQASLFGQTAFSRGDAKCTYGTGSFILMNTGSEPKYSRHGLLTTIGWKLGKDIIYAIEGSIFASGALITWLKEGLEIIASPSETESLAREVKDNGGVYFSGALTGLGAPYWDASARGTLIGLTRGTKKGHIVRAVLEYITFRTREILELMEEETGIKLKKLLVDGGVTRNNFLMEMQANVLGIPVDRSLIKETTALGAAMLSGLCTGLWDMEVLKNRRISEVEFEPSGNRMEEEFSKWKEALRRSMNWER